MREEEPKFSLVLLMAALLLLLVGVLLYFYHLGQSDLYHDNPARIAVYVDQMNQQGRWLAAVLNGRACYDVPPLYLWAVKLASMFSSTGAVGPYAVRYPSAASALMIVLLAGFWFYQHARRYGRDDGVEAPPEGFALLAGLMVATSPVLFNMSRAGTQESLFALLYLAAAFCWSESLEARRSFYAGQSWRIWVLWGYALAGLAMLANGPVVLALLWVPYALAARSYRLRKPDWAHLAGLALTLGIGSWWFLLMIVRHPGAAATFWLKLIPPFDNKWSHLGSVLDYLSYLVIGGFPWIVLAVVMIVRVLRKQDRSPTLVFWTWSLTGNLLWFWLAGAESDRHLLPMIPFIALLTADALHRWNFETFASLVWRTLLRVALVLAIAAGIFMATLLSSDVGIVLYILIAVGWLGWSIGSRVRGVQYTYWETTVRLSAVAVLVILAGEVILASNWEPRKRFQKEIIAYFERIHDLLPEDATPRIVLFDDRMQPLYDYYLQRDLPRSMDLAAIQRQADRNTYLVSSRKLDGLARDPRLVPLTFCPDSRPGRVREGLFRVIPLSDWATTMTLEGRLALREPLRVGVLGNAGTRSARQRDVGRRLDKYASRHTIDDILMLGNNLYGPSVFEHLDFIDAFEVPYRRLLKRGILFHALLGHEDQSYSWVQTHYDPFHMYARRYYSPGRDIHARRRGAARGKRPGRRATCLARRGACRIGGALEGGRHSPGPPQRGRRWQARYGTGRKITAAAGSPPRADRPLVGRPVVRAAARPRPRAGIHQRRLERQQGRNPVSERSAPEKRLRFASGIRHAGIHRDRRFVPGPDRQRPTRRWRRDRPARRRRRGTLTCRPHLKPPIAPGQRTPRPPRPAVLSGSSLWAAPLASRPVGQPRWWICSTRPSARCAAGS
ncbi:MAG: glycosyltransferase family 39 protein [bacterium]|nr:glycosyltransferase family 39 protein [bacterium]